MQGWQADAPLFDRRGRLLVAAGGCIDAWVVTAAARAGVLHLLSASPTAAEAVTGDAAR